MRSWRAARPGAPWSVEECADFAARRQFKYVSMLSVADESVVAMALRMQGVHFVDGNVPDAHIQLLHPYHVGSGNVCHEADVVLRRGGDALLSGVLSLLGAREGAGGGFASFKRYLL